MTFMLKIMKIVSWNVNSINARFDHVKQYLDEEKPDVLMVQELKTADFPHDKFVETGYKTHAVPQKAYNGVAIFTKDTPNIIAEKLDGDDTDKQSRYLEFEYDGLRLINIYLPNGNPAPGDKYDYKLKWMERLYTRLKSLRENDVPFAIGGDFNVIPQEKDCYNANVWRDDALFMLPTRKAFRKLLNLGLTDAFRVHNNLAEQYTYWDYQAGAWDQNHGIRIDHFLLSPMVTDRLKSCTVNTNPRGWERPSDHTAIELELS